MNATAPLDAFNGPVANEPDLGTPEAEAAERSVLGAVMARDEAFEAARAALTPDHFVKPAHRYVFEAMVALHGRGEPPGDCALVLEELARMGRRGDVPAGLIWGLQEGVPKGVNVQFYADRIRDKYELRRIKDWAWRLYCAAAKEQATGEALFGEAERRLRDVVAGGRQGRAVGGEELAARLGAYVSDVLDHGPRRGLTTGFYDIDNATTGFHPGDLIIIAGRPSMGKTSLAGAMAWHVATHGGIVLFESLEMMTDTVMKRLACLEARVNFQHLREGRINQTEVTALVAAQAKLEQSGIYIDDQARTVMDMRRLGRQVKAEAGKLDLMIIDYLGIMKPSATTGRKIDSRVREVGEMTAELKLMAKEMAIPIIALAQLNRSPDGREDKRPRLSDIRESGEVEQDADLVAFMYLHHKYDKTAPPNVGEFIIEKQRNGPTLRIDLAWDGPTMRYGNLERSS